MWIANRHQFGAGKIHLIDQESPDKTLCGRWLSSTPGKPGKAEATCVNCRNAAINRPLREEQRRQWAAQSAQYQQEQEEKNRQWWARYDKYLQSEVWRAKRAAVLDRARGLCEGCRNAKATQVHHLTYDHVFEEPLWDLVASCSACHERVTTLDRARRLRTFRGGSNG